MRARTLALCCVRMSETLRREIAGSGWVELLAEMVRTPSHPGVPRQEEAVVEVLRRYFENRGVPCATTDVTPGRPNLLARTGGDAPGRRLLLCGHTDTVPLNQGDPGAGFSAEIRDGRLYVKSEGTIRMFEGLGFPWSLMAALRVLPLPWRDALYGVMARNRLKWFGRREVCFLGEAGWQDRFLA